MPISVKSEIAPLKRVLLHHPGKELEYLTPDSLDRLLFDDIPFLEEAQKEHGQFSRILRENGAEVVYLEDLASAALKTSPAVREAFLDEFVLQSPRPEYRAELRNFLSSISDERELILKTMSGITFQELDVPRKHVLPSLLGRMNDFVSDPQPNLYFTRDPFESIGEGVAINRMHSVTRCQETIYARYIFNYHPEFAGKTNLYTSGVEDYAMEGGDVLNLSADTIAVGISERTSPEAIELLAKRIFADEASTIRTILALEIPYMRTCMHLDTVLTQVDYNKFVVFPDMLSNLRIFKITPGTGGELIIRETASDLVRALEDVLHLDYVDLILCGGGDRVAARREQWNDGSNTLCVAPGIVLAYNRNAVTNEVFSKHGIQVLTFQGSELARGRGGPRCMSMPLNRE